MGDREPKSLAAVARRDEAALRIRALKTYMTGRGLGPDGVRAFAEVSRPRPGEQAGGRPRYPAIGKREAMWLDRIDDRDA
jgi:hypothetical protein